MININELKNELVGLELNCLELDNKMMSLGFYEEYDNYTEELLNDECIGYVSKKNTENVIIIDFKISIKHSEDEDVKATYLKITDVR